MLLVLLILSAISIVCCETNFPIAVAYYDEIKDLPNHCEKLLVDVREPSELERTGRIPLSINVPCKRLINLKKKYSLEERLLFAVAEVEKTFSQETSNEEFMKLYNHAKPKFTDKIIVYCRTGRRSQIAAETLI